MRAKVYGGCAACVVVLFGTTCPACYAAAVIAVEVSIAERCDEIEAYKADWNSWAATFSTLGEMSG